MNFTPALRVTLLASALISRIRFRGFRTHRGIDVATIITTAFFSINTAQAGPFLAGGAGVSDTNPALQEWASGVMDFTPGPVDIANPSGAKASFGDPSAALGPAGATSDNPYVVVSLGDGGSMTLSFANPITNGPGADFAVYENGFQSGGANSYFLELATVAVSSDGIHFFTFPSVSLTQTSTQVGGFGTLDPSNLYNLAGSQPAGYGTPFNLDDLSAINSPYLNINDITEVRVTDVIGNINTSLDNGTGNPAYTYDDASNPIFDGAYGTTNHLINDPYSTPFTTGGFDLDGIGVLNAVPESSAVRYLTLGFFILVVARGFFRRSRAWIP